MGGIVKCGGALLGGGARSVPGAKRGSAAYKTPTGEEGCPFLLLAFLRPGQ
jgi:hypothetical protein